jgi:hypothetical protein
MLAASATPPGKGKYYVVVIVPQKGGKVNMNEAIETLRAQMQELEDMKTQLTEAQENLREAICALEMMEEAG